MAEREQLVMDTFVELADTLATDYDVGDFLQLLVERCADILRVDTGGVLIEGPQGELRLAAATSEKMKDLEDLEIKLRQGPCMDAYRGVEQVLAMDLSAMQERWPAIVEAAAGMGLVAAYAFPLRLREDCIGALNLYRETTGHFEHDDVRLGQAFADVATIGILQERKISDAQRRAAQLQGALNTRVLIERANGVLAERHDFSFQEAFDTIRRHARNHRRPLREVCREIVEGRDRVQPSR